MAEITNFNELASEVARRCQNSEGFKGDLNVAQASHVLKHVKEILCEAGMIGSGTITKMLEDCFDIELRIIGWGKAPATLDEKTAEPQV